LWAVAATHVSRYIGDGFQYHSSQLIFSDQWYGPQSVTQRTRVRLSVLSHSHRQVLDTYLSPLTIDRYPHTNRATEKMLRPWSWSQQARQLTPRRGTVAHLRNQGCCVHIHTGNLLRVKYGSISLPVVPLAATGSRARESLVSRG